LMYFHEWFESNMGREQKVKKILLERFPVFLLGFWISILGNPLLNAQLVSSTDEVGKGIIDEKAAKYEEAMDWYQKAADKGNVEGYLHMGGLYEETAGHGQDYEKKALECYRIAAKKGSAEAETKIGFIYEDGLAGPSDFKEALKWYRKADAHGDPQATFQIGCFYQRGEGVTLDYKEAMKYYRKVASKEFPAAELSIGFLYEQGWGVPEDLPEALKWYRKALHHGFRQAQREVDDVQRKIDSKKEH